MSGRGRGRPPSRSAPESAAGPSRRSTRHQQQQLNTLESPEQQHEQHEQQDQDEDQYQDQDQNQGRDQELELAHRQQPEQGAAMPASMYHEIIDPAITGPQDGGMPPPPAPSAKGLRGQAGPPHVARRGTRRDIRASSMASINSVPATDAFSSQPEPQSTAPHHGTPAPGLIMPSRVSSQAASDTPGRSAARGRLMNSMLMRLFTASDDLVNQLCSDPADAEIWEAERTGFKFVFEPYRSHFLRDAVDPVVDPDFVTDSMRLGRATEMWDKAVRVVSAANLASLLYEITPIGHNDPLPLLQSWDPVFPDFFIGAPSDNNDLEMNEQVIEQVLMIRTHLSIFTLERLQRDAPVPFHPIEQVARIWCDGHVSVEAVEAFLGGNTDALQLKPIARAESEAAALARDRNATRFLSICSMLPNQLVEGYGLDLSPVHETYPLEEFVDNLRAFAKTCFARIKTLLLQEPSAAARDAFLAFAASNAASRAESQMRSQLEAESMAHAFDRGESSAPVAYNMSSLRMMKELEQQAPGAYGDAHQIPQSSYPPAPRIPYPPGFNTSPPSSLGYADPTQQSDFSNGAMYAESAALVAGRKRQSQDGPAADGTVGSATHPAKKARGRRKKGGAPEAAMAPAPAPPASAPAATPIAPSPYPPLPGTQDEPDLEALSQRNREISAAARKVKEPQVRSAWVRKDVSLLIKAVNIYQCKWSTIEKEIKAGTVPFERPRDQQALRDKARLLKQDFLKADAVLPRGFDLVVLGKKEREAVKAVGKNPDRREGDIDENSQPVNTELAPLVAPAPEPLPPAEPQPEEQLQALPEEPQPAVLEPAAV